LLGSPGLEKGAAAGLRLPGIPRWQFAVEVQWWVAAANPLKD